MTPNTNTFFAVRTTGQSVFCLSFQKILKRLLADNSQITLIIFYQNFNVVLEKTTAHNIDR